MKKDEKTLAMQFYRAFETGKNDGVTLIQMIENSEITKTLSDLDYYFTDDDKLKSVAFDASRTINNEYEELRYLYTEYLDKTKAYLVKAIDKIEDELIHQHAILLAMEFSNDKKSIEKSIEELTVLTDERTFGKS